MKFIVSSNIISYSICYKLIIFKLIKIDKIKNDENKESFFCEKFPWFVTIDIKQDIRSLVFPKINDKSTQNGNHWSN